MKIAIYYDSLISKGGAERVVIQLANQLGADIITSGYDPNINSWIPINVNVINLGNQSTAIFKPLGILFEAPLRFFLNKNMFDYDVNIYCGFSSIYCSSKKYKSKNVWFCLTPNRILYDLRKVVIKNARMFAKPAFYSYQLVFSWLDQHVIKNNFEDIISQTFTVSKRVKDYYGKKSKVIYPPVDINKYKFKQFGDFYLAVSRFYPEKRMSLIAETFAKMPNKKLVIVGDGPEKGKIKKIIKNSKNIKLVGDISEKKLVDLYSNCLAVVYMPINEDFGLVPLEGMASGKMCIAANEGGCRETVIDGKTGFLVKASEENIRRIINTFDKNQAKKMKAACMIQANKFSINTCVSKWKKEIETLTTE